MVFLMFYQSSSLSSSLVQVGKLSKFFDQWRSITSNWFVPNMVKGHYLQLRSHPPLFCDFRWFNIKAALAHHSIIQKEIDELLAKGATEPSTCGVGNYSNIFVVTKHTGGFQPILNLKQFNHYMHIPTFKMPTIRQVWQLIQQGNYTFLLIPRMLIYIFLLLSITIAFYILFDNANLINGELCHLAWLHPYGFHLTHWTHTAPLPL